MGHMKTLKKAGTLDNGKRTHGKGTKMIPLRLNNTDIQPIIFKWLRDCSKKMGKLVCS